MHLEEKPDATEWSGRCRIFFSPKSRSLPLVTGHLYLASCYFSGFFTQHTLIQYVLCPGTAFFPITHRSLFFSGFLVKASSVKVGWRFPCSSWCCQSLASLRFVSPIHYSDTWWVEIHPPRTALKGCSLFNQVAGVHWVCRHGCSRCWTRGEQGGAPQWFCKYRILREWRALKEEIFEMHAEDGQVSWARNLSYMTLAFF